MIAGLCGRKGLSAMLNQLNIVYQHYLKNLFASKFFHDESMMVSVCGASFFHSKQE
jgi:hypothetical protein